MTALAHPTIVTKRIMRRRNARSGPESKPGFTIRVYCPDCTDDQQMQNNNKYRAHPQFRIHMTVVEGQRQATCPNGHTFDIHN